MADLGGPARALQVKLVWEQPEGAAAFATAFNAIADQDGITLTLGQPVTPLLSGTAEDVRAEAVGIKEVPIRVVGRFAISFQRARELQALLGQVIPKDPTTKDPTPTEIKRD